MSSRAAVERLCALELPVRQTRAPHLFLARCPICVGRALTLYLAGAPDAPQCAVICARGCDPEALVTLLEGGAS